MGKKDGVVAKADFIGGNAVTTNTGDSGVFVNENTAKMFPKQQSMLRPCRLK